MITISLKVFTSSDSYNDNGCQLAYIGCFFNNQHFFQEFFHIRCCGQLWVCATDSV